MKLILKSVKIYGYDPNVFRVFDNNGKETKQYSVGLYISEEDRTLIDSYIYGKCETTRDGEILFYGKSKQMIPVFDAEKNKITKPINEVFLADVSILVDEFQEKDNEGSLKFNDDGTPLMVRYIKCLGIKYISPVANEETRMVKKGFETFDDIFSEDEETSELQPKPDIYDAMKKPEELMQTASRVEDLPQPSFAPESAMPDDLPF
jgi:hypothetical protein